MPTSKWTLERLIEPEDEEVCLRYILKYSTKGASSIFQLFDTSEKRDHLVANRRRWLEHQGGRVAMQERWQNEWQDIKYQGANKVRVSQRRRRPLGVDAWPREC